MKRLLSTVLLVILLTGCTCLTKDPHDYLPGWEDNVLEFGKPYYKLRFVDVSGHWTNYEFTEPGWYGTHDGANIDYAIMCE